MRLLRRLLFSRSGTFGLLSDIAMVAAAASRVARRSSAGSGRRASANPGEWLLVAGAAVRLLRRIRRVRRNRRLVAAVDDVVAE
ncbi:MAG: hypothetical protein OEV40_03670 [Acidimicrobiia bacterium]|nr:hypothetical protein [Acidimicrobiia bacterium]